MYLSDRDLRALLRERPQTVTPLMDNAVQAASVELRLGRNLLFYRVARVSARRPEAIKYEECEIPDDGFWLPPGAFCLAESVEQVSIPRSLASQVGGKSTHGRSGLLIHATAGHLDPGFCGRITLELANLSNHSIELWVEMPIAQLHFIRLTSPADLPYGDPSLGSHYQNQTGVQGPLGVARGDVLAE